MQRLIASWLIVVVLVIAGGHPAEAKTEKKVGVILWSEEARYEASARGVMDELAKLGFSGSALAVTVEHADGSKARLAEITQRFSERRMDLIVAIGTTATIAATKRTREIPVVFSYVYDPVETGIAGGWKSSGNNSTGASSKVPMPKEMETLKSFGPVARLAVLYTPGEKNSETQLKELESLQQPFRIKVIPVIVPREEEVPQVLPGVVRIADAIYLTGSSVVGNTVATITEQASKARIITITHLEDLVDRGVLLGVCADPYHLGRMAGKKAARILRGAQPSAIPIEPARKVDLVLNRSAVAAGHFQVPPSFLKKVTKLR